MSHTPHQPYQHNLLAKTTSTRSCQSLICLTKRCREQEEKKQKQKMLNSSYFQKLSLKKFNMNSSTFNESFYDKNMNDKTIKKDKSTEDSDFQNIQLKNMCKQSQIIISHQPRHSQHNNNNRITTTYNQNDHPTQRIIRSSSSTQLSNQPQLKQFTTTTTNDCLIQRQINIDLQKLQHLSKLRSSLEKEIQQLDSNIDKYYNVYQVKVEELRRIKNRLKQVEEQEEKHVVEKKIVVVDRLECGLFRKKGYVEEITPRGNNHEMLTGGRQQKHSLQMIHKQHLASNKPNNNHVFPIVNQSPKYSHNTNFTFNKNINN